MKKTADITVDYLGLKLCSPIVPSASPLSQEIEALVEMENCGAGAVVLRSLFEDPWEPSLPTPAAYFEEIARAKQHVKIPIIASLSATSESGWRTLAGQIADAGADALELNIYHPRLSRYVPSSLAEQTYIDTVKAVTHAVRIPVSVKLPPFFTNLAFLVRELRLAGASGIVLFNRFYQPDLDLLAMAPSYTLRLSTSAENRLPLRSLPLLYQQSEMDLAASTGIRSGADILKMILSGASITQVCAILLQRGIPWLKTLEQELRHWMDTCNISSLKKARGILSRRMMEDPGQIEREEYRKALQGYAQIDIPSWRDEVPLHIDSELKN